MRSIVKGLVGLFAVFSLGLTPALAQMRSIDPNTAIDADLAPLPQQGNGAPPPAEQNVTVDNGVYDAQTNTQAATTGNAADPAAQAATANQSAVYQKDDLIGAAEGVFGKGAKGLAGLIEKILGDQGEPNAYIAGREASGAFVVGLRYGSGTLFHKVEGQREVYWTGPSVGFDFGGNASNSFVLVYNLYDSQDIFKRFPAGEGAAYLVGGFTASYLRRGDVVLIPIRLGVGYRLGANVGYMKFTEKSNWLPF
ncbi:MAG: DUF1134 domain-containing protein [Alphaproteobacteria bacterium]|nr:DUF1134 domain-containing protein [Alphaproteobacteria bacterium]